MLALADKNYAYWSHPTYLYYYVPEPIQLHVDTDRPIYRPGQKVLVKETAVTRVPQGFKLYSGKSAIAVKAHDANGQEFFSYLKVPNEMGSVTTEFEIPTNRSIFRGSAGGGAGAQVVLTEWNF
ncbi:MAG: hypothetical protein A2Y62_21755 [Candidatus Fischerbacteria bacterium RBG_13_37_8]|uniref:Macroglobulin domain-containing protein n=1 Tax=Candidatus Fischerbacteria bacterium RBG_13_37_8 TaxID=1817863 RepID=A0A1F5VTV4_9BACT|nr:MAG: hypothetical protein A2Y62_21755 [Candidatus Fischerbacteria bacterium RBG_13_37_8]